MPARLTLSRRSATKIGSTTPTTTTSFEVNKKKDKNNQFCLIHNLNELEEVTLQNALDCLVRRYTEGIFYTFAGSLLISLNPCLPNSRKSCMDIDHMTFVREHDDNCTKETSKPKPHIFSVGRKCLSGLRLVGNNQVVVVSGDSGAGKTTVTQQLLCFFIDKSCQIVEMKTPNSLDKKIYFATLILEALGNASTTTNSNSSRFGRFIQLDYYGNTGWIIGAEIRTCLLEKHRVSKFGRNERNFHIFYYILAGLKSGVLKTSELLDENDEPFDWKSGISVEFQDAISETDIFHVKSLCRSFQQLKLTKELEKIFRVVYGILLLLNVSFLPMKDDDDLLNEDCHQDYIEFVPKDEKLIRTIGEIFAIDPKKLTDILVSSTITVQGGRTRRQSVFRKPCKSEAECKSRISALTSSLYNSLFHSILSRLNSLFKISSGSTEFQTSSLTLPKHKLSLLDLYGFENLETNHLEQLCINYANERLQLVHLQTMKRYSTEILNLGDGVAPNELSKIESESTQRLQGIHETIFLVLNEACLLKRNVSEVDTFQRLKNLTANNIFIESLNVQRSDCPFVIKHYATNVQYSFAGMIDKNSDCVPTEIQELFRMSSNAFVKLLFTDLQEAESGIRLNMNKSTKREKTILHRFKLSVDELVAELANDDNQDLHFIRCIRPNDNLTVGQITPGVVKRQLFSSGIVDVIKIASNGYPIRIQKAKFTRLFPAIFTRLFPTGTEGTVIADTLNLSSNGMRIGSNQYFLSEEAWIFLKKLESMLARMYVVKIQKYWRQMISRRKEAKYLVYSIKNECGGGDCSDGTENTSSSSEIVKLVPVLDVELENKPFIANENTKVTRIITHLRTDVTAKYIIQIIEKLNLRLKNGIVTRGQLPKTPVRFHTRKTLLEFSHYSPKSQGLNELLIMAQKN